MERFCFSFSSQLNFTLSFSVVGVAASYDEHAFRYNMCWRLQGQRREMIEGTNRIDLSVRPHKNVFFFTRTDFQSIMKEHLEYFRKKNGGVLPEKILYYRDGVSEGQFDQVMAIERNDMLQACQAVQPGYEKTVKMTIVVVQKRHHTRFFPGKTGIGKDDRKNNNVPAGTIVDSHITRPNENHFYLVSHQSIQGVAKPTKYCILLDEGDHNIDDLQVLTYNVSFWKVFVDTTLSIIRLIIFSSVTCSRDVIVRSRTQHQRTMLIWLHIVDAFTLSKSIGNFLHRFLQLLLTSVNLWCFQK